ncbi:MAG: heparinase II/III-family protein, partial [Bacteroidetes bacterium]|nr:heparinase II/III-family protein [Bacteroidota bacterium]
MKNIFLVAGAAETRDTANVGSIKFGAETSSLREVHPDSLSLESLSKVHLSVNDSVYLLPTLSHYFSTVEAAMKILQENALIYAVTGDTAAGNYAKEALIIIAGWKTWNHPWFAARHRETYYPLGELGVRAAFCYDVVYPLMTRKERDDVCEGLLKNCVIPAYEEYVLHDRVPSATSNWVGNTVSGGISCALAIYGDDPKLGDLEPYLSGLIGMLRDYIHNTLDTTGAWGEGIGYQGFAYSNVLPTLSVIKSVLHLDLTSRGLLKSYKYFLYNFSKPDILDVGDSHPELSTLSEFAWLSSHSKDPVFQWLYMKSPRKDIFDFMFGTDKGPETPPRSLPKSIEFPELGAVVFRSGWSPDDIVMNFRCGHFFNHQHYDQGSFQLNAYGVSLIPEAGWANYYNDPWYRRYYIQPVGHNTLLLDEDAGSQESGDYLHFIKAADRSAKITDFIETDSYSATTGELANLYYGKLSLFERNIIFMHRRYFVIYDRVKSYKVPHEYDLLFHFNDLKEVSLNSKNTFTLTTDSASLYSQVVFPDKPKLELFDGPIHFGVPIKRPGYVQVSNSSKSMG